VNNFSFEKLRTPPLAGSQTMLTVRRIRAGYNTCSDVTRARILFLDRVLNILNVPDVVLRSIIESARECRETKCYKFREKKCPIDTSTSFNVYKSNSVRAVFHGTYLSFFFFFIKNVHARETIRLYFHLRTRFKFNNETFSRCFERYNTTFRLSNIRIG